MGTLPCPGLGTAVCEEAAGPALALGSLGRVALLAGGTRGTFLLCFLLSQPLWKSLCPQSLCGGAGSALCLVLGSASISLGSWQLCQGDVSTRTSSGEMFLVVPPPWCAAWPCWERLCEVWDAEDAEERLQGQAGMQDRRLCLPPALWGSFLEAG